MSDTFKVSDTPSNRRPAATPDPIELATRALGPRERSRHEIEQRLARAGIGEEERRAALATLERLGYVDDGRFAAARADALAGRGHGDEWIRRDLREHGVERETAEEAVASLVPEPERAAAIVAREGASRRLAARLARKGFAAESVEASFADDVERA